MPSQRPPRTDPQPVVGRTHFRAAGPLPKYLFRRGSALYFKRKIPADVAHGFPECKGQMWKSLGTSLLEKARVGHIRQGIGSRLLAWAQSQSTGSLGLYTFARNQRARQFYERHGFRAVAFGFEPTWQLDDVRYEWQGTWGLVHQLRPKPL
jgi:hypothetical protein